MLYFKRLPIAALAQLPLAVTLAITLAKTTSAYAETGQLVVTATRMAQTIDQSLVPVSVITREEIEQSPASSLPELLSQLPGMDFSVSGGHGKQASLYLRGTSSSQLLVLIDGIKIGSSTLGSTPFEDIPLAQIERIEVVRGPRSSLYGSEAIGGVVQIFTKKAQQGMTGSASVGAGNHNTQDLRAGIGFGSEQGSLAVNVSHLKTDGINANIGLDPDLDGYENTSVSINLNARISATTNAELTVLRTDATNHYDGFSTPFDDYAENMQQTLGARLTSEISDSWSLSGGIHQYRNDSENYFLDYMSALPSQSQINTKRYGADIKSDLYLNENQIVSAGLDYQNDQVSGSSAYSVDERDNTGVFGQWQAQYGQLNVLAGLRHDDNEAFGTKNTGNINLGYQLDSKRRVLASYGTAYKAPTFNDLYFPFDGFFQGNPLVNPESSKTAELGYEVNQGAVNYAARAFVTRIDDLIEWVFIDCFPCSPQNVQQAEIKGLEFEGGFVVDQWRGNASVSFLDPRDRDSDKVLQNRARRTLQFNLTRSFNTFSVSAGLLAQGERYTDASNTTKLPGYGVVNLKAQYELAKNWAIEAKVNNLLDKEYSTNAGYNSLDRSYLLTLSYNR